MRLGVIGLGRMGAAMAQRLMKHGHACVVYDAHAQAIEKLAAEGAIGASSRADFVARLPRPRAIWLMIPAAAVDEEPAALVPLLEADDIVIDGSNSYYRDDIRRAGELEARRLLDLTAAALAADPALSNYAGRVSDSGEGRWTIVAAIDEAVPTPVLSAALYERFSSRGEAEFANRILSAMRHEFGGHAERR